MLIAIFALRDEGRSKRMKKYVKGLASGMDEKTYEHILQRPFGQPAIQKDWDEEVP